MDSNHCKFVDIEIICQFCQMRKKSMFNMLRNSKITCCCNYNVEKYEHLIEQHGQSKCCHVCKDLVFIPKEFNFSLSLLDENNNDCLTCKECNYCVSINYLNSNYISLEEVHNENYCYRNWLEDY